MPLWTLLNNLQIVSECVDYIFTIILPFIFERSWSPFMRWVLVKKKKHLPCEACPVQEICFIIQIPLSNLYLFGNILAKTVLALLLYRVVVFVFFFKSCLAFDILANQIFKFPKGITMSILNWGSGSVCYFQDGRERHMTKKYEYVFEKYAYSDIFVLSTLLLRMDFCVYIDM